MDAFFASVEELDNPALLGKPIIVGADPMGGKGRGVVSTCSYAAREFGVHSAMPISRAWKLCPHGIYTYPRMSRYVEVSEKVMAVFNSFTPLIQPISIDEAFLDITGSVRLFGDPSTIAEKIKAEVFNKTHLTCSVGVAWVKSLAKIASDINKPDGVTIVPKGHEKEFLAPLEVRKLWGVGPKAAKILADEHIHFAGDIQARSRTQIVSLFGKAGGSHIWNMANGLDVREVRDDEKARSISHETTFFADVNDEDTLNRTLLWLSDKVASRLRKHGIKGRVITVKYRTEDFKTYTKRITLGETVDDTSTLFETSRKLVAPLTKKKGKVRLLGIAVSRFTEGDEMQQMSLFDTGKKSLNTNTEKAVDQVRARFGKNAIVRGSLLDDRKE